MKRAENTTEQIHMATMMTLSKDIFRKKGDFSLRITHFILLFLESFLSKGKKCRSVAQKNVMNSAVFGMNRVRKVTNLKPYTILSF